MDELKKEVVSSIKDYFSSKICGFNFNDDQQMEDYINGMIADLCDDVCSRIDDKSDEIDAELEWWENTYGKTYYQKRTYEDNIIYGARYD